MGLKDNLDFFFFFFLAMSKKDLHLAPLKQNKASIIKPWSPDHKCLESHHFQMDVVVLQG
jgi:hypothetical protein